MSDVFDIHKKTSSSSTPNDDQPSWKQLSISTYFTFILPLAHSTVISIPPPVPNLPHSSITHQFAATRPPSSGTTNHQPNRTKPEPRGDRRLPFNMYPAFSQTVSLRVTPPSLRVHPLVNTHITPVMNARRPGTSSFCYSFRFGTLFSRSGNNNYQANLPPSPAQEYPIVDTSATTGDQATPSPGSHTFASCTPKSRAAFRTDPTNPGKPQRSSRSLSFQLPFLGTIHVPGNLVLMFVPVLWSSYSILIKWLYRLPWALTPALFNFMRLIVGSIMLLPVFTPKTITRPILTAGAELGFWTVLANLIQFVGLRHTTASRAAFLSQLSAILVPLIAVAVGMENRLASSIIFSAPLSMIGVALLTLDGAAPSFIGDSIMIGGAFVTASYVLRSKRYSHLASTTLVASKTIFQTLFAGIFLLLTPTQPLSFVGATPLWLTVNILFVLYAGFFIGFLSTILQIRGQSVVSASETAVIFTTNPLWASLLAIPLGERFGPKGFAGASIILLATALASGIFVRQKPQKKISEVG